MACCPAASPPDKRDPGGCSPDAPARHGRPPAGLEQRIDLRDDERGRAFSPRMASAQVGAAPAAQHPAARERSAPASSGCWAWRIWSMVVLVILLQSAQTRQAATTGA